MKVDFTRETIVVDGVEMSLEFLRALANPRPATIYRLIREGDIVTVQSHTFGESFPDWVKDLFLG